MVYVSHTDLRAAFDGFLLLALCAGALGGVLLLLLVWLYRVMLRGLLDHIGGHVLVPRAGAGGMGVTPMVGLSRPAYPPASGAAFLGRPADHGPVTPHPPGAVGRVVKRSDEPRPTVSALPWPHSCLEDKRAAGAPAGRGGDATFLLALAFSWGAVTLLAFLFA